MGRLGAALVCLLFAVPFGAVGVGASWLLGRMVYDHQRSAEWVRVKATVDSFSRGKVQYRYRMGDVEYRGDRLGLNPLEGRDSIDSWQADMFNMLSAAKTAKKPIMVLVNPDNPAESMVDRTLRWKLVAFALPFALGFGAVGVGALFMFFRTLVRDPDAPAQPTRSRGILAAWLFAFMWNVISFPIAIAVIPGAWDDGQWGVMFVLIFPLIGVLLLWGAISTTIKAIGDMFRREPELPTLLVPKAAAPMNDGVFARGMLGDTRPAATGAVAASIDAGDDGLPPPPDPAIARFEKLSGKSLTAAEREQLDKMSPATRAVMGKLEGWLGRVKEAQDK
jgi:hypothetical protein